MKLLLAFVTAASLFCLPLHAEEVIVNASAKIYNSDTVHARDQALKNVLVEAVKKGVGSLLDTKTTNINYEVIKSQIYSASTKFILDYEVLSEQQNFDNNLYEIIITANINAEKIRQKLKTLRIFQDKMENKRLMVLYRSRVPEAVPRENEIVATALATVQVSFAEQSFRTFSEQTMIQVHSSLEKEDIVARTVDTLIALALNYNADILVIMGINTGQRDKQQGTLNKVSAAVHFSVYDAATGQQITETNVEAYEISPKNPSDLEKINLMGKAAEHAVIENVRRSTEQITRFYQEMGVLGQGYSIIFSGYSPWRESLIIDYLENTTDFRNLAELKNTFGYLELELFTLKRKSILRRRITSDLLEQKIEVATKSIAGNNLYFINPNPMEEEEEEEEGGEKLPADNSSETSVETTTEETLSQ